MGTILRIIRNTPSIGVIPAEMLAWVDARSHAGAGHGDRVARLCDVLAAGMNCAALGSDELHMAAHAHEIGFLSGQATDPVDLAWRSADLLADLGSPAAVVRIVRHLSERWDGLGGPDRLRDFEIPAGSAIMAVADALDHYSAARILTGSPPSIAVDRAVSQMLSQQRSIFSPEVVQAALSERSAVRDICGVSRAAVAGTDRTRRAAFVYPTIATTLLGRLS